MKKAPKGNSKGGNSGRQPWEKMSQQQKDVILDKIEHPDVVVRPRDSDLVFQKLRIDFKLPQLSSDTGNDEDSDDSVDDDETDKHRSRNATNAKTFEVIISLGNDKMKIEDVHKALKHEYAARYLERIGVAPTIHNMAIIEKKAPIEKCIIQQVFQPGLSKSERKNFISIRPGHKVKATPTLQEQAFVPFETLPQTLLTKAQPPKQEQTPTDGDEAPVHRVMKYEEYKSKYVFPYSISPHPPQHVTSARRPQSPKALTSPTVPHNLDSNYNEARSVTDHRLRMQDIILGKLKGLTKTEVDQLGLGEVPDGHASKLESLLRHTPDIPDDVPAVPTRKLSQSSRSMKPQEPNEIRDALTMKEVEVVPDMALAEIVPYRDAFVDGFPFVDLWPDLRGYMDYTRPNRVKQQQLPTSKLSKQTRYMIHLILFLRSDEIVRFVLDVLSMLFLIYLTPKSRDYGLSRTYNNDVDAKFIATFSRYLDIMHQRCENRMGAALDGPLLLLMLRVIIESVCRELFPNWSSSTDGVITRKRMDLFLSTVFDPVGFQQHIAVIESSTSALQVLHHKRPPRRMDLSYTSPLIRFVVGEAHSKEAQTLLSCRDDNPHGLEELKTVLTPAVRSQLLALFAKKKMK
eukprot:PhF_6_TR19957/c0_g1_i1/m.29087